ncbi:MAG: hypothetical protein ACO3QC_00370 [Phycisphaerales bacterium]
MRVSYAAIFLAGVVSAVACLASCGPRVEYRARPGFATGDEMPDEITLDDGTIVRYIPVSEFLARKKARKEGRDFDAARAAQASEGAAPKPGFVAWEELQDGSVRMSAIMPEHVVANTMRAFREERYAELWSQLVARDVRDRAEAAEGKDAARDRFVAWAARKRTDVMTLLNRMSFGFSTNAVIMRKIGPTTLQLTLAPQVAGEFKVKVVEIEYEGDRVTLAGIR